MNRIQKYRSILKRGISMISHVEFFDTQEAAWEYLNRLNQVLERAVYVVVCGPEDNWAVVDLDTSSNLACPYFSEQFESLEDYAKP